MARGEGPHENARNISRPGSQKGITDVIRWRRTLQRTCDASAPLVRALRSRPHDMT